MPGRYAESENAGGAEVISNNCDIQLRRADAVETLQLYNPPTDLYT